MKIAILTSGGVDSSVALNLLAREGSHELEAFYLKIWLEEELAHLGDCPWETDLACVREICEALDIPLRVVPLQTEYLERVVGHAISELEAGRTPSPDILCNQHIKFGAFFDAIDDDFDKVATGHYARIEAQNGSSLLKRAPDPVKDQTYFLCTLSQQQLSRLLFPIGHLQKSAVRQLADEFDLPNKHRKDSQGLCFLGKIKYAEFVKFHLGEKTGFIIEKETDRRLGTHNGVWFHTIGQRQGLELGGGPWYVVAKDLAQNTLTVTHQDNLAVHECDAFTVGDINWLCRPPKTADLQLKIRHGPQLSSCRIANLDNGRLHVEMAPADPGVASGQSAVFYEGEICLGGGMIE